MVSSLVKAEILLLYSVVSMRTVTRPLSAGRILISASRDSDCKACFSSRDKLEGGGRLKRSEVVSRNLTSGCISFGSVCMIGSKFARYYSVGKCDGVGAKFKPRCKRDFSESQSVFYDRLTMVRRFWLSLGAYSGLLPYSR